MKIKHIVVILALTLAFVSCVGQKEDAPDVPKEKEEEEEPEPQEETAEFLKRTLAVEFTATWCVYCPDMKESIDSVSKRHKDRIVEMSIHYADEMGCSAGDSLIKRFSITSWPTVVFDMNPEWRTSSSSVAVLSALADSALSACSHTCGIRAESSVSGDTLKVSIYAKSSDDGKYKLHVAIVEDGISARQAGRGDGYIHNSVLRSIPFSDDLILTENIESTVSFEYVIPENQCPANIRLIVCLLETDTGEYRVNNVIQFAAGQNIGYEYRHP